MRRHRDRGSNEPAAVTLPNLCQTTFVQSALAGTMERAGKYLRKAQMLNAEGVTGVIGGGGAVGGIAPALDGVLLKSFSFGRGDTTQSELLRSAAPSRRDALCDNSYFMGRVASQRRVRFAASKLARPFCLQQGIPRKLRRKKQPEHGLDAPAAFGSVS
jgi:hypothetical protein